MPTTIGISTAAVATRFQVIRNPLRNRSLHLITSREINHAGDGRMVEGKWRGTIRLKYEHLQFVAAIRSPGLQSFESVSNFRLAYQSGNDRIREMTSICAFMRVSFQAFDRSKAWHVAGQQLAHLRGWSPFVADRIQPDRANRRAGGVVRSIDAALRVPENAPHPYYWQAHPDFAASLLPCFAIRYGRPICLPPWRI